MPSRFDPQIAVTTLTLPKVSGDVLRAFLAATLQAKNLYNSALYLIRQVVTAYEYDSERKLNILKDDIRPEQQATIDHFNSIIVARNQKRADEYEAKSAKKRANGEEVTPLKAVPLLLPQMKNLYASLLEITVLETAVKTRPDENGEFVFKRIPAAMAQQLLWLVADNFKSYFKATKEYGINPDKFTGRPAMPDYKERNDRMVLEIPVANTHGHFPKLSGKRIRIPENYLETEWLPSECIKAFSDYDLGSQIARACQKRGLTDFTAQHVRIVPTRRNGIKIEVVVNVRKTYPADSFLARFEQTHAEALLMLKSQKERDSFIEKAVKAMLSPDLNIAGGDLGSNNLITLAFSTGAAGAVHSGKDFNAKIGSFNDRVDALIAQHSTPRAKELQAKKNALIKLGQKLEKAEERGLRTLLKQVYALPEYQRLMKNRQGYIDNYLHQLSHAVVAQCAKNKIDVIVIGKNPLWKQEINIGRDNNRTFNQIAHARLIEQIQYKAELQGMVVITTEESYTSKASFVNNDALKVYDKNTSKSEKTPHAFTGKRSQDNRNWFVNKNRSDRLGKVNADINGAFNIIRKIFKDFRYQAALSLQFVVYTLCNKRGMIPLQI